MAVVIIVIGIAFVFAVSWEKVDLNKMSDSITISIRNIICISNVYSKKLSEIINVSIVKRG